MIICDYEKNSFVFNQSLSKNHFAGSWFFPGAKNFGTMPSLSQLFGIHAPVRGKIRRD